MASLNRKDVLAKVTEVIAQQAGMGKESVLPSSILTRDLDIDSLDLVDIAMELDEVYGDAIPLELDYFITVDGIVDLICGIKAVA